MNWLVFSGTCDGSKAYVVHVSTESSTCNSHLLMGLGPCGVIILPKPRFSVRCIAYAQHKIPRTKIFHQLDPRILLLTGGFLRSRQTKHVPGLHDYRKTDSESNE